MSAETGALAATPHPLGKPGGPGLFHDRSLSLPPYVQNIAQSLMDKRGMPRSKAIQVALGVVQNWASGRGNVKPEVRAAASAAVAAWEAAKAKAKATPNKGDVKLAHHFDPAEPRDPDGKWSALEAMKKLLAEANAEEESRPYPKVDHDSSWSNVSLNGKSLKDSDVDKTVGGENTHLAEKSVTPQEYNAMNEYVAYDSDTQRINRKLRNGEPLDAEEEARNKGLDSVARKAALSRDTDLWRGSSLTEDQIKSLKPGAVVQDKGYASTSFTRGVAEYYMHERDSSAGKKVMFRIQGKKGAPVIPVRGDETVIPHGATMRVTHVSEHEGIPLITVSYTPSADTGKKVELSQPMTLLRAILDGAQTVELASSSLTAGARQKAASEHLAMSDGSYPIRSVAELHKAIQAYGRAKDPEAVKRWIIKRAKQLKALKALPENWDVPDGDKDADDVKLAQPMQASRQPAAKGPQAGSQGQKQPAGKAPVKTPAGKADQGQYQKGRHQLPPGAVGWRHGWIPVDGSGKAVGPSQENMPSQEIKDMAGHDQATKDAIAQAYKNKATADAKTAAKKNAAATKKAASAKAAAAKKAAAAQKKIGSAKAAAAKKTAAAKAKAATQAQKTAAAQKKAHQQLVTQATKQALADKKAGRPLTPSQQKLLDAYNAQQQATLDHLRNGVSLSQPVELGVSATFGGDSSYVTTPTVSSQDGGRFTVNTLKSSVPKRVMADAVKKAQKKRRIGRRKGGK